MRGLAGRLAEDDVCVVDDEDELVRDGLDELVERAVTSSSGEP